MERSVLCIHVFGTCHECTMCSGVHAEASCSVLLRFCSTTFAFQGFKFSVADNPVYFFGWLVLLLLGLSLIFNILFRTVFCAIIW